MIEFIDFSYIFLINLYITIVTRKYSLNVNVRKLGHKTGIITF